MVIKRLLPDGSPDPDYQSVVLNHDGVSATLKADGPVYLGGYFTNMDGVTVQNLLRLNADGTVDAGFRPRFAVCSRFSGQPAEH